METEKTRFLRTMIEIIKYGEYPQKTEMLSILRNSAITYNPTSDFTRKSYQCWEDVEIRVPVPLMKEAKKYLPEFDAIVRDIYIQTKEYDIRKVLIKPKLIESDSIKVKEHEVYFDEIQDTIIQGIRGAKYLIWIAVAWFTDKDIFNELLLRKQDGVDVKVIISDDKGNNSLAKELFEEFNVVKVPKTGIWNNIGLHDKFCIIDLEYVMHGSYNWSRNAQSNDETLATALDKDFVLKFADEFKRLYKEYNGSKTKTSFKF